MEITYRPAVDGDANQLIELVDICYQEYDGCILDVDAEEPQLRYIATYYREKGGEFWVAEKDGIIVGSIGYSMNEDTLELKHLYVNSVIRRQGMASSLCTMVEDAAARREASRIILWTDTRFTNAHRLYEKRGFEGGSETRTLQDLSKTVEYYYEKPLTY